METAATTVLVVGESANEALRAENGRIRGCRLLRAADRIEALRQAESQPLDLVLVFDRDDSDMFEILSELRKSSSVSQHFVLLGNSDAVESVTLDERIAIICEGLESLLGRDEHPEVAEAPVELASQGLVMNSRRHRAVVDGRPIKLTPTEFRLLWMLLSEPGTVFTRRQLTDACVGQNMHVQVRTVDVHVKSIRRKLGDRAELLQTVRGNGYRLHEADGE